MNNSQRDKLVRLILSETFSEEECVLWDECAAIGSAVYDDLYTVRERDLMADLPDGWLPTVGNLEVRFATDHTRIDFNGDMYGYGDERTKFFTRDSVFRAVSSRHKGSCVKVYDANHELCVRWREFESAKKAYLGRVAELRTETKAVIYSCTTTNSLVSKWPEVAPFVKALNIPAPVDKLPATRIDNLSVRLGLKEERAA
ncbi:gp23 [Alphaproteobacteria phage PhiJL001]|uniref:Gp23 n=1 Tax=Alphaproteobacteria phage PhiJL001 TaxID=2681607 RepID=Q5DN82_9CAUD|nr:gp23 [Alphaproteobacteria phage PhiJL001]AAT69499.1 gp23 [Alphaproteobacteria phage PhiJL001]